MSTSIIRDFMQKESAGGILLVVASIIAMAMENSPFYFLYNALLETPVSIQVGALVLHKPLLLWINDGLMAVFFFLVGLEIKREVAEGELSDPARLVIPAIAAVGGMLVPAMVYVALNRGDPAALSGWAIPTATDIAFALGVLSLLGMGLSIGVAVASIVNLLSPDTVVLGGGLAEAMPDLFVKEVKKAAKSRCMPSYADTFEVVDAKLGDDASVMGAAAWARDCTQ